MGITGFATRVTHTSGLQGTYRLTLASTGQAGTAGHLQRERIQGVEHGRAWGNQLTPVCPGLPDHSSESPCTGWELWSQANQDGWSPWGQLSREEQQRKKRIKITVTRISKIPKMASLLSRTETPGGAPFPIPDSPGST